MTSELEELFPLLSPRSNLLLEDTVNALDSYFFFDLETPSIGQKRPGDQLPNPPRKLMKTGPLSPKPFVVNTLIFNRGNFSAVPQVRTNQIGAGLEGDNIIHRSFALRIEKRDSEFDSLFIAVHKGKDSIEFPYSITTHNIPPPTRNNEYLEIRNCHGNIIEVYFLKFFKEKTVRDLKKKYGSSFRLTITPAIGNTKLASMKWKLTLGGKNYLSNTAPHNRSC